MAVFDEYVGRLETLASKGTNALLITFVLLVPFVAALSFAGLPQVHFCNCSRK